MDTGDSKRRSTVESSALEMWTVYDHPSDFPEECVARLWLITKAGEAPTSVLLRAGTLAELRKKRPLGLVVLARMPEDDPTIVETWV